MFIIACTPATDVAATNYTLKRRMSLYIKGKVDSNIPKVGMIIALLLNCFMYLYRNRTCPFTTVIRHVHCYPIALLCSYKRKSRLTVK